MDDRRHSSVNDNWDVVVNMGFAVSYAGIYKQCVELAKFQDISAIQSKQWFLMQFWPCTKTASTIMQYTGRFNVRRMVQARILRKHNPDAHYVNAIFKFLKDRAIKTSSETIFLSADEKCKVSIGEPDYPIAAVSRGKKVIVGLNQSFEVADHDFSKISVIPDAILIHDIPSEI